jgi:hypothetical protein
MQPMIAHRKEATMKNLRTLDKRQVPGFTALAVQACR